jgi:hypothetical protein
MSEVDFLVKMRDGASMIADACNERLEKLAPPETKEAEQPREMRTWNWNPNGIKWTDATGKKGSYEKSEDYNSLDHKALIKDLAAHQSKLSRDGFFYWLFENGSTIGRKKRQDQS